MKRCSMFRHYLAVLVCQRRSDDHEDHRAGATGLFIDILDSRSHRNPIAGTDRHTENKLHTGGQTSRSLRKHFKGKFREAKQTGKGRRSGLAKPCSRRSSVLTAGWRRRIADRVTKIRNHLGGDFHRNPGLELTADQRLVEFDHDSSQSEPRVESLSSRKRATRGLLRKPRTRAL